MKRFLLAAVASLSLVTAAVTAEGWNLTAVVNGNHTAVFSPNGVRAVFPNKAHCDGLLASDLFKVEVLDDFTAYEQNEHGAGTTIVWACVPEDTLEPPGDPA